MTAPDDGRFERWCEANGITNILQHRTDDGVWTLHYFRSDGSEVSPADSFGYDAALTPYTRTGGRS